MGVKPNCARFGFALYNVASKTRNLACGGAGGAVGGVVGGTVGAAVGARSRAPCHYAVDTATGERQERECRKTEARRPSK